MFPSIATSLPKEIKIAQSLAAYAIDALEKDALYAIEKGIKGFINENLTQADRDERRRLNRQGTKLKELMKATHPFDNSKSATEQLLLVLCTSVDEIQTKLKNLPRVDVYEWVRGIYGMVSPRDTNVASSSRGARSTVTLGAPFFRQGSSAEVFTQVFRALRELCPHSTWSGEQEWCIQPIVSQLEAHRIHRYPHSHALGSGRRASQFAHYKSWQDLVYPTGSSTMAMGSNLSSDPEQLAASLVSTQITEQNPQASWEWVKTKLEDLPWIIKRTRLPSDWIHLEDAQNDTLCNELTAWLSNSFNKSDARFHISLIAAIILTAWAPFHRVKAPEDASKKKHSKQANMVDYGKNLPWDQEYGMKQSGWKARAPLFHLWLVFISGVLVDSSPWWERRRQKDKTSKKKPSRTEEQERNIEIVTQFQGKLCKLFSLITLLS